MSSLFKKIISVFLVAAFVTGNVFADLAGSAVLYYEKPCWNNGSLAASAGSAMQSQAVYENNSRESTQAGDPVSIASGSFNYTNQDIFIPSRGLNIELTRSYGTVNKVEGPFGWGWSHNYNSYLVPIASGSSAYILHVTTDGHRDKFTVAANGSYTAPAGSYATLAKIGSGYILTDTHGNAETYGSDGKLTTLSDRNGNTLALSYDTNDYLIRVNDTLNRAITFTYNDNKKISAVTDPSGRVWQYAYDASNNLVSVTAPKPSDDGTAPVTAYTYDADHNLLTVTDANSNTYITNMYNVTGKVLTQKYGDGITTFKYEDLKTTVNDPLGYATQYYFNSDDLTVKVIYPDAKALINEYNSNKQPTRATWPNGNTMLYEYDTKGNTTKVTRKAISGLNDIDLIATFTYDPTCNFIKTSTDPRGKVTTYSYDLKGNLTSIVYPVPATDRAQPQLTFTYNTFGQVVTAVNPANVVTKYEYSNDTGYLTRIVNDYGGNSKLNASTAFTYDNRGNVLTTTDALGHVAKFEYDNLNRLVLSSPVIAGVAAAITKYKYDADGNLTKLEKQANAEATRWQTIDYTYDTLDQLTQIKQYLGVDSILVTKFEYDLNGNKTRVIDANNKETVYTYDTRNLLVTVTDALNNTTTYTYDGDKNLQTITDAKNNVAAYTYDSFNRLAKTTYPDSSYEQYVYDASSNLISKRTRKGDIINYSYDNLNRLTTETYPNSTNVVYTYDIASRLIQVNSANSTLAYTYDNLNRVLTTTATNGTLQPKTIAYQYDKLNRTRLTYPDNTNINYEYDNLNRLATIKDSTSNTIASYTYDVLNRRTQTDLANNTQTTYSYDNVNRLVTMANKINGGANISTFGFAYDAVGNRLSKTTTVGQETYGYDNLNQLTSVQYPAGSPFANTGFNYDPLGNRITVTNGSATTYTANNLNQYTQVNSATLNYDSNGNLTGNAGWTYSYDYENRLTSATNGTTTASYGYDAFGRRISKTVGGVTTNYFYDGDSLIAEYDASDTLLRKYIHSDNIDEPIAMISGSNTYYYNRDGLGSTSELTDGTGTTVEKYQYDVYGKTIIKDSSDNVLTASAIGNRFGFTGRELDVETGLYFYRARYYSPDLGRFLQTDPVDYMDGSSIYEYCFNNPVNYSDSTGEFGEGLIWTTVKKVVKSVVQKFVKTEGKKIAHKGFIKGLREMEDKSVRKTIKSLEKQIAKHAESLRDPNQIRSIPHHQQELKVFKEQLELAKQEAAMRGVSATSAAVVGTASVATGNGNCPEKGKGWVEQVLDVVTDFISDPVDDLN